MKFIVDAQLPRSLCKLINQLGGDCIHTLDLPDKNRTNDNQILDLSEAQERIVITKDGDFLQSFILKKLPPKLLLVSTGNINNDALLLLFSENFSAMVDLLKQNDLIELTKFEIVVH